jgi:hypothetical protein
MRGLVSAILCVFAGVLFQSAACFGYLTEKGAGRIGWEDVGTHNQFTLYSINNLIFEGTIRQKLIDNKEDILYGNSQEDDEFTSNALMHFYDPNLSDNQRGMLGFPSENAKTRAQGYYGKALKAYRADNIGFAWERLGRALHLLQDMAVPAHVNRANHWQHATLWKNGYEWWVAKNWDGSSLYPGFLIKRYLDHLLTGNPYFRRPIMAGTMGGYMEAMAIQSRYGYMYDEAPLAALYPFPFYYVSDDEAKHTASVLVPSAIQASGGLL